VASQFFANERDVGQLDLSYGSLSDAFSLDSLTFLFGERNSQKTKYESGKGGQIPDKRYFVGRETEHPPIRIGWAKVGRVWSV